MKRFARILSSMLVALALLPCLRSHAARVSWPIPASCPSWANRTFRKSLCAGYGRVSGRQYVFGNGSILEIDCENADRAELTQAKYLSDLQLLPGVRPVRLKNRLEGWKIDAQGAIAAIRLENKTFILASSRLEGLETLIHYGSAGKSGPDGLRRNSGPNVAGPLG